MLYLTLGLVIISAIIIEYRYAYQNGKGHIYNKQDLVENMNIGSGQILVSFFSQALLLVLFSYVQTNFGIIDVKFNALNFIVVLLCLDFMMYLLHIATHKVNVLWAMHLVHHSSTHYNLGLTMRNPWFFSLVYMVPYCLFALIGVDVKLFMAALAVGGLIKTFQHASFVGDLGFLGKIIVSPKFHRAHHGIQEKYWDKNYGRAFSFWDRLFKTDIETDEETIRYGIKDERNSNSALVENTYYFKYLYLMAKETKSVKEKIKVFLMPPSYLPSDVSRDTSNMLLDEAVNQVKATKPASTLALKISAINLAGILIFATLVEGATIGQKLAFTIVSLMIIYLSGIILTKEVQEDNQTKTLLENLKA